MFYFVVRHLHWLARVPGLPHFFDAFLVSGTFLFHRARVKAMENLEAGVLRLPGVRLSVHRFGGTEFVNAKGREFGHIHGNGLLDVLVGTESAKRLLKEGRVSAHHVLPHSKWVSFQLNSRADVPFALELLALAYARLLTTQQFNLQQGKSSGPSVTS